MASSYGPSARLRWKHLNATEGGVQITPRDVVCALRSPPRISRRAVSTLHARCMHVESTLQEGLRMRIQRDVHPVIEAATPMASSPLDVRAV
eukprot:6202235-Pleurochrysis_carterae.AAC.1